MTVSFVFVSATLHAAPPLAGADLFNIFVQYATFGRAERSEEMTSNQVRQHWSSWEGLHGGSCSWKALKWAPPADLPHLVTQSCSSSAAQPHAPATPVTLQLSLTSSTTNGHAHACGGTCAHPPLTPTLRTIPHRLK